MQLFDRARFASLALGLSLSTLAAACGGDGEALDGSTEAGARDAGRGDAGRITPPRGIGLLCTGDGDCPTGGVCRPQMGGERRCTASCAASSECVGGWTCESSLCACLGQGTGTAEVCNNRDDDCNGYVDDGLDSNECVTACMGTRCGDGRCVTDPTDCDRCTVPPDQVDLLLMIDNSNSMAEEQANLALQIPIIVQVLASGDLDGDGEEDFPPVNSLHIGVVSSDMGAGANAGVPSCEMGGGDDGLLQRAGNGGAGCMDHPNGIFGFMAGGGVTPAAYAAQVGCVANLGTTGCGFEQQLESPLKALTPSQADITSGAVTWTAPSYVPPTFVNTGTETTGHGSGPNRSFIRPNSILAVMVVTDEEDCSVSDPSLFVANNPMFTTVPLNLRCTNFANDPAYVYPVQRFIDGFAGLRAVPGQVVFAAITGIPLAHDPAMSGDLTPFESTEDFDRLLAEPAMQYMENINGNGLRPSCESPNGSAAPPRRIAQTARGLQAAGASTTLASICSGDFRPAIQGVVAKIVDALVNSCVQ